MNKHLSIYLKCGHPYKIVWRLFVKNKEIINKISIILMQAKLRFKSKQFLCDHLTFRQEMFYSSW